jgi:hypothetical protein
MPPNGLSPFDFPTEMLYIDKETGYGLPITVPLTKRKEVSVPHKKEGDCTAGPSASFDLSYIPQSCRQPHPIDQNEFNGQVPDLNL